MRTGVTAVAALAALAGGVSTASAAIVDLTTSGSAGVINGARFETADFRTAGTGVINPFVRMQKNGTEHGYNTSGRPVAFDEKTDSNYTRNLTYGEIPVRNIEGTDYKEFILDINQTNANPLLSLDKVQIYTSAVGSQTTGTVSSLGTLRYDMDAGGDSWVKLNYDLGTGSGQGDMKMYVPVSAFGGVGNSTFVYLYSFFGSNIASNDGFEEWSVLDGGGSVVPLPPGAIAGGLTLVGVVGLRKLRRRG